MVISTRSDERRRLAARTLCLLGLGLLPEGRAHAQHLRVAEDVAPASLNPAYRTAMVEARLNELMFLGLFKDDRQLEPSPALAAKWDPVDEGRGLRVVLADALWHDGQPVTSADVAFTVDALKHARSRSPERRKVAFIEAVEVIDERTFVLRFTEPMRDPARRIQFKVLPRHAFPKAPPLSPRDEFRRQPVGTGPFAFARATRDGGGISLRRVGDPGSGIASMDVRFIEDKTRQLQTLQFGGVDAIVRVLPKHRAEIVGLGTVDLHPYESLSWWYIGVNHRSKALADVRVRRALAQALDRDALRSTHLGDGTTISGPFAPRSPFYDLSVEPWAHDPAAVTAAMSEAGYTLKDGVFHKKGRPLRLRMVLSNNLDAYQDVCLDLQSRLKRAGFEVELVWVDPAAYAERVLKKHDFELTIDSWTFDESSNIYPLFHSKGTRNYVGYQNPEMDRLLEVSREAKAPEKFLEAYLAIHRLAHDDLPYVFLWSVRSYSAVTKELTGVDIHPFRYFTWVEKWRFREP